MVFLPSAPSFNLTVHMACHQPCFSELSGHSCIFLSMVSSPSTCGACGCHVLQVWDPLLYCPQSFKLSNFSESSVKGLIMSERFLSSIIVICAVTCYTMESSLTKLAVASLFESASGPRLAPTLVLSLPPFLQSSFFLLHLGYAKNYSSVACGRFTPAKIYEKSCLKHTSKEPKNTSTQLDDLVTPRMNFSKKTCMVTNALLKISWSVKKHFNIFDERLTFCRGPHNFVLNCTYMMHRQPGDDSDAYILSTLNQRLIQPKTGSFLNS